ncbi:MAG: flagellar filament capping protein FliD, partial [Rubripirellula sp.]
SGKSADIDLRDARTINDVLLAINDADVDVRATTVGNALQLVDLSGATASNLQVEQLGTAESAADLGLWGVDVASASVTGTEIELPSGVGALRGASLAELNGGNGVGPLGTLRVTLSDGSNGAIDLSTATNTSEVIDAIAASGLPLTARINDARTGIQLRDVSGGGGAITISSDDDTASSLGLEGTYNDSIIVGGNLNRQTVTRDTRLSELNQGIGVDSGSFTITDSAGQTSAVNLTVEGITNVGQLIDAINNLSIGVNASLNDAGDGIAIADSAGGSAPLTIEDTGSGTTASDLGIAGVATTQTVGGDLVEALVGTQASLFDIDADDTLDSLVAKLNESGRYAVASIEQNEDATVSLRIRSQQGGGSGQISIETVGFELDLRTDTVGRDAKITVATDGGPERVHSSADGVFDLDGDQSTKRSISRSTILDDIASGADRGSFMVTNSEGETSAINLTVQGISTVGQLVDAINDLGIGVTAAVNDAGNGIAVVDTTAGAGTLTVSDTGNGVAASSLGIAGVATTQSVNGASVSAIVGPAEVSGDDESGGLVLTLKQLSDTPISVTVEEDAATVITAAKSFVDQYNLLVDKLNSLTFYNADSEEVGLLFGSSETLRIENGYTRLLSGRISGAGDLKSIGQVGLRLNDQGKLDLDSTKLTEAIESGGGDVEEFFTANEAGLANRLSGLADRLAGEGTGMLLNRSQTLSSQIDFNNSRIDSLDVRLERERERLLRKYYSMEEAIAKIQTNQSAIAQIQPISIPT